MAKNGSRKRLITSPAYLVAIARAAHLAGDGDLAKMAKDELRQEFGIEIDFARERSLTVGARLLNVAGTELNDGPGEVNK